MRQRCPDDARILVGEHHGGDIGISPLSQEHQPTVSAGRGASDCRVRNVLRVSDPEQSFLPATGLLPRHQAKPGRKLSTVPKVLAHFKRWATTALADGGPSPANISKGLQQCDFTAEELRRIDRENALRILLTRETYRN